MNVPLWLQVAGATSYALWAGVFVVAAGIHLSRWKVTHTRVHLYLVMAAMLLAVRFFLLAAALGPISLIDKRYTQIAAWLIDIVALLPAIVALFIYLRAAYREAPPQLKRRDHD